MQDDTIYIYVWSWQRLQGIQPVSREITRMVTEFQEGEEIEPGIAYLTMIVDQTIKDGLG